MPALAVVRITRRMQPDDLLRALEAASPAFARRSDRIKRQLVWRFLCEADRGRRRVVVDIEEGLAVQRMR